MVNRLLKKLHLPEDSRPASASATTPRPSSTVTRPGIARPRTIPRIGPWTRVGLAVLLAIALPLWPYRHACGFGLFFYLVGVTTLIVAGVWAGLATWERQVAVAHILSLVAVVWGLGLGASVILPRMGYAKTPATWRCGAVAATAANGGGVAAHAPPCRALGTHRLPPDVVVSAFACEGNATLRLERRVLAALTGTPAVEERDVVMVPPLATDERFLLGVCRLDGTPDAAVAAVVRMQNAATLRNIRVAFRVDRRRQRFEPVAAERVTCANEAYGV